MTSDDPAFTPRDAPRPEGAPARGTGPRDAAESRRLTLGLGGFAIASVALFIAVYAPALASVAPGRGIRPMTVSMLLVAVLARGGWIPCVVLGIRQLLGRPRVYGLISIGLGVLQAAAYSLTEWLLMGSRGIHWGP